MSALPSPHPPPSIFPKNNATSANQGQCLAYLLCRTASADEGFLFHSAKQKPRCPDGQNCHAKHALGNFATQAVRPRFCGLRLLNFWISRLALSEQKHWRQSMRPKELPTFFQMKHSGFGRRQISSLRKHCRKFAGNGKEYTSDRNCFASSVLFKKIF